MTSDQGVWEQRWHPLRREWVIVTSHRNKRPWSGGEVETSSADIPDYVHDCYLCPGNQRVSGCVNPDYEQVYVFDNDHPSVGLNAPVELEQPQGIYQNQPATGIARVVCYDPRHNVSLAELNANQCREVLLSLRQECAALGSRAEIKSVFLFENKGEVTGVSNPHPHCQIYGTSFIVPGIQLELDSVNQHFSETGASLFDEIIDAEKSDGRRIIAENATAIAFIPYFARFPYETYIVSKSHATSLGDLSEQQIADFSKVLQDVLIRFDNLWRSSFPYIMVFHQAPCDGQKQNHYRFHIQFHPPLRQPGLQKYLAGTETGGGLFLNDTCPEEKAAELRSLPGVHYKTDPKARNDDE
jgi:UDPglucose--hexose-1-phosphate uridylyltransferase